MVKLKHLTKISHIRNKSLEGNQVIGAEMRPSGNTLESLKNLKPLFIIIGLIALGIILGLIFGFMLGQTRVLIG